MPTVSGRCLCGAVSFTAEVESPAIDACHCASCRRWSGHFWASANTTTTGLRVRTGEDDLTWYRSSEEVRRGFCRRCGSALFWQPDRHPEYGHLVAVSAGSLDGPSGVELARHIFVAEKGDYYDLVDGLPQRPGH